MAGETYAPCARRKCGHSILDHRVNAAGKNSCLTCHCPWHLADNDCPECEGTGRELRDNRKGELRMYDCPDCAGSGLRPSPTPAPAPASATERKHHERQDTPRSA